LTKNVGELDAYLRITGGLTLLGIGIISSSKFLTFLGSMKVAEGVTRYCPMYHLLGMDSLDWDLKLKKADPEEAEIPDNA